MTLLLTEDQASLRELIADVLDSNADITRVRAVQDGPDDFDSQLWDVLAEVGVPSLLVPEDFGGMGLGLTEASVVLEELGRRAVSAPYLSSAIATATIIRSGDDALASDVLPAIAEGRTRLTLAFAESSGNWIPEVPRVRATERPGGEWALSGVKTFVVDGVSAHGFIVLASTVDGVGLFLVDAEATGVSLESLGVLDGGFAAASVSFVDASARRIATADTSRFIDEVDAVAAVLGAAHLYGGFAHALAAAVQYAKDRYQFGRSIGSFQGVKFPLAELEVDRELALSLLRRATWSADHAAETFVVDAVAAHVKLQAIALEGAIRYVTTLGGIGYTWEHEAHLYQKQAATGRLLLGTPDDRAQRLAMALGL